MPASSLSQASAWGLRQPSRAERSCTGGARAARDHCRTQPRQPRSGSPAPGPSVQGVGALPTARSRGTGRSPPTGARCAEVGDGAGLSLRSWQTRAQATPRWPAIPVKSGDALPTNSEVMSNQRLMPRASPWPAAGLAPSSAPPTAAGAPARPATQRRLFGSRPVPPWARSSRWSSPRRCDS